MCGTINIVLEIIDFQKLFHKYFGKGSPTTGISEATKHTGFEVNKNRDDLA